MWKLHGGRKVKINQLIDLATTFVQIPTHTHKVICMQANVSTLGEVSCIFTQNSAVISFFWSEKVISIDGAEKRR